MFIRKAIPIVLIAFYFVWTVTCAKKTSEIPEDKILARIGDKVLTTDEFIRRAEYTIRPGYCKLDNYIHKKIVLNSLIAEKLLATEADEDNPLLKSESFKAYIRGRKEQAMRQLLYYDEAYQKVECDTSEIRKEFRLAGRKYNISYYSVSDSSVAKELRDGLNTNQFDLKSIVQHFGGNSTLPKREVSWQSKEDKQIHEALFKQEVKRNQIIGPISVEKGNFLFIQVDGWTDSVVMTEQSSQKRWEDAKERLNDEKAEAIWADQVLQIMKDKKIEFVVDTFWKLNQMYYDIYMVTEEEKRDAFNKQFWEKQDIEKTLDNLADGDALLKVPFFKLDDKFWTVRDFKELISSHPLVFRKQRMKKAEFPEQFKYAIADLIRDKFITDEAYMKGYDRRSEVRMNADMWQDAALALYQRDTYLKGMGAQKEGNPNDVKVINNYLNPYIDTLQNKYKDQIEINVEAFEKLTLTRIDLFAKQPDQPYPVVVPSFPMITTDNRLDYGDTMTR